MKKQKNKVILQNKPSSKLKTLQWKNKKQELFYKTTKQKENKPKISTCTSAVATRRLDRFERLERLDMPAVKPNKDPPVGGGFDIDGRARIHTAQKHYEVDRGKWFVCMYSEKT